MKVFISLLSITFFATFAHSQNNEEQILRTYDCKAGLKKVVDFAESADGKDWPLDEEDFVFEEGSYYEFETKIFDKSLLVFEDVTDYYSEFLMPDPVEPNKALRALASAAEDVIAVRDDASEGIAYQLRFEKRQVPSDRPFPVLPEERGYLSLYLKEKNEKQSAYRIYVSIVDTVNREDSERIASYFGELNCRRN